MSSFENGLLTPSSPHFSFSNMDMASNKANLQCSNHRTSMFRLARLKSVFEHFSRRCSSLYNFGQLLIPVISASHSFSDGWYLHLEKMRQKCTEFSRSLRNNLKMQTLYTYLAVEAGHLRKLGSQQIRQIIRTFLGLQLLCYADIRVRDMFNDVFVEQNFSISYIIAGHISILLFPKLETGEVGLAYPPIFPQHLRLSKFSSQFFTWRCSGGSWICGFLSWRSQESELHSLCRQFLKLLGNLWKSGSWDPGTVLWRCICSTINELRCLRLRKRAMIGFKGTQRDQSLNGDNPKTILSTMSLECDNWFEEL